MLDGSDLIPKIPLLLVRLSWLAGIIEYFIMGLFIEHLIQKRFRFGARHLFFLTLNILFSIVIVYTAITAFNTVDPDQRWFELIIYKLHIWYAPLSMLPSVLIALYKDKNNPTPVILQKQLRLLLICLILPHSLLVLTLFNPLALVSPLKTISLDRYIFVALNDFLYLGMLYFCAKQILCLRFLNTTKHVQAPVKYNFVDNFKDILTRLGQVISVNELITITTNFFSRAFRIRPEDIRLYIRLQTGASEPTPHHEAPTVLSHMETWLGNPQNRSMLEYMVKNRILIKDELAFDYFYDEDPQQQQLLELLKTLKADILIPIYERTQIIAYIIIGEGSRPNNLFSNIERDEMCVFASYLGAIAYLLQHRNLSELIRQEKAWQEDLYLKQQEINHYKESIRTLLKTTAQRTIGIIHYQGKKLSWSNHTAQNMFQEIFAKEPLQTAPLKQLAQEVIRYRTERSLLLNDPNGRQVQYVATPYGDGSQAIILAYYPDIADTFTIPFNLLKDVTSWEYALYLETTESGKLINQLIPSSSEAFLNFKIDLLKIALSKKATLLELPEEDLPAIVNLIHHIGLRSKLHTCTLTRPERSHEIALQLFGVEPILSSDTRNCLLTSLNDTGTLFIQNIEFLSPETQQKLANYITNGMFQPIKSDRCLRTNVRIICSTTTNLELLVSQNKFSADLLRELQSTAITLPSLLTIPRDEIASLARQVTEQTIQSKELRPLMDLNSSEAHSILEHATSLHSLKEHIHQVLQSKSHKQQLNHLVKLDPANINEINPEIAHAIRLGKQSLKDKRLMNLLWNTFQSQTKIATLLNVNRSSINRRCKEFNLL